MICPRCLHRGQTWKGDPPKCAFEADEFTGENWNCETLNALRRLCSHDDDQRHPACTSVGNCDQWCGTIPAEGSFVVLSWCKNRGHTEAAIFVDEGAVHALTLEEAESVLDLYGLHAPGAEA